MAALCAEAAACGSFFTRFLPVTRTTPANSELQLEQLHLVVFLGSALETPAVAEKGSLPTSVPVRYSLTSYASVCVSCSMSGLHGHAAKPKAQLLGSQWPGWGGVPRGNETDKGHDGVGENPTGAEKTPAGWQFKNAPALAPPRSSL